MLMMLVQWWAGANDAHDACPVAAGLGQNMLAVGGNDAHDARPVLVA